MRAVDRVRAGAGLEDHARDGGLALAGRAVARAGGEVDRGVGDRLRRGPPRPRRSPAVLVVLVLVLAAQGLLALADDVDLEVHAGDRRLDARRLVARRRPRAPRRRRPSAASATASSAARLVGARPRAPRRRSPARGSAAPRRSALLGAPAASSAAASPRRVGSSAGVSSCSARRRLVRHQVLDLQRLRLLRRVRMLGARVDLELRELLAGEAVAGQHALARRGG